MEKLIKAGRKYGRIGKDVMMEENCGALGILPWRESIGVKIEAGT